MKQIYGLLTGFENTKGIYVAYSFVLPFQTKKVGAKMLIFKKVKKPVVI